MKAREIEKVLLEYTDPLNARLAARTIARLSAKESGDTKRLDWMSKMQNRRWVVASDFGIILFSDSMNPRARKDPRDAIDAAMRSDRGGRRG